MLVLGVNRYLLSTTFSSSYTTLMSRLLPSDTEHKQMCHHAQCYRKGTLEKENYSITAILYSVVPQASL